MDQPVRITEKAVQEIKAILEKKKVPFGYGLRMSVKGRHGCAGVNYALGFDKKKENDQTFIQEELEIHIQKGELMYLIGKTVDFYEGADARGFVFTDSPED